MEQRLDRANHFTHPLAHLWMDDTGASLIEVALVGTLILVVVLLAVLAFAKTV